MEYKEFRNAAYRHLVSCKQMLADVTNTQIQQDVKNRLCLEIYYLSGYILETMLSYAVCSSMNVEGDINKSKPFTTDSAEFKTHRLMQKYNYALNNGCIGLRNLCFFQTPHQNSDIQKLFTNWTVEYRYKKRENISQDLLVEYMNSIENIYEEIFKKYTI